MKGSMDKPDIIAMVGYFEKLRNEFHRLGSLWKKQKDLLKEQGLIIDTLTKTVEGLIKYIDQNISKGK